MKLNVEKSKSGLKGEIIIPSDKSISHRAVMFSGLAKGLSVVENFSRGGDCLSTLSVMQNLGIKAEFKDENTLVIDSKNGLFASRGDLYCGNSGTTMRLMSGILAGQEFDSVLTGDESLSKRPMARVIKPLEMMGANISSNENKAPLKIFGQNLLGIDYISELASAQVKSCVLLAGLFAQGKTSFTEPHPSRDHTERMLKYLGANIFFGEQETVNGEWKNVAELSILRPGGEKVPTGRMRGEFRTVIEKSELVPQAITVAGDISSAAFFIAAALVVQNSDIILKNVGLNPTRTGILDVATKMGANIEILDKKLVSNEEVGDLRIKYSELHATTIEGEIIPRLIDELPVIAVLATQAEGTTIIKDAGDLRNKESDRIKAIVTELKKLGADIEETPDGFVIQGESVLKGDAEVQTYHDHRLAMSLYVAGLICEKPILINEFEWTNISFPEFEGLMNNLQQ